MKHILVFFASHFFLLNNIFASNEDIPKNPVIMSAQFFTQGETQYLALNYENAAHWHTYWKNPGDAGLPIKNVFKIEGVEFDYSEMTWPLPEVMKEEGDMESFGYNGSYSLFFKIKNFAAIVDKKLSIKSSWLVCKNVCIPGKAEVTGVIKSSSLMFDQSGRKLSVSLKDLRLRLQLLPVEIPFPRDFDLILAKGDAKSDLALFYHISLNPAVAWPKGKPILIPYPVDVIEFKRERLHRDKKGIIYARYGLGWNGQYLEPTWPLPADGKFKKPLELKFLYYNPVDKKIAIIKKQFNRFNLKAHENLATFFSIVPPLDKGNISGDQGPAFKPAPAAVVATTEETPSFLYYLLFAFIGGLILNVMPCVLPVISIKLFGLLQFRDSSPKKIMAHNLIYSLGVITTFLALAIVITILKSSSEVIGWGFQLQSPTFVAIMAIVIFLFALNLFEVFEFKTPGGNKLGGMEIEDGPIGDFFSGVLATILSTPCSAPFLGTALTFAFTADTFSILTVFLFIGLGMAFPFIISAFFPQLIHFLPKPGKWMNDLKKFLGLSLILTAIWLLDVFSNLTNSIYGLIEINTILALGFFYLYMRKEITKQKKYLIPMLILPLYLMVDLTLNEINADRVVSTSSSNENLKLGNDGLSWVKFSPEKLLAQKNAGQIVFIDFTAKWCFTCKINEKLIINTDKFKGLVEKYQVQLLLGDWTRRDAVIGKWLADHGKVGVPAYFVLKADGTLLSLGETLSFDELESSFR